MNIGEHNIRRLQQLLLRMSGLFKRAEEWIETRTKTDKQWIIIILLLAALLRLPLLNYPDRTLFDEVIYANFAVHIIHHEPFFDIHPPLARIIFAMVANNSSFEIWGFPMETNKEFGDFPYATLRLFMALIGTLFPLLLYLIGRLLKYSPRSAGILALFAVFDNALVLYSRSILPDTLLLFLNFLGLAAAFAAANIAHKKIERVFLVILSGIALGLALSIKWTALAMFPLVGLIFIFARMYRSIALVGILGILVYLSVFSLYFTNFPNGGHVDPVLYPYNKPWIAEMTFPKGDHLKNIIAYLPEIHEAMLRANEDPDIAKVTLQSAGPLSWPAARSSLTFWISDDGKHTIILRGNEFLWFLTFFMIIFEIGWIIEKSRKRRKWPIDKTESILLLGYLSNYAPFFLIHRPMYLYHYFTAFIFLLLLLPRIAPRVIHCIGNITHDRTLAHVMMYFSILLVLINFILIAPTTYGW